MISLRGLPNKRSFDPSQIAHTQSKRFKAGILFWVFFGEAKQHANAHPFELLRLCAATPPPYRSIN